MILGTPETKPGEYAEASHGGQGQFFVRTLLNDVPGSSFKYVRDIILFPGSSIGEHPHLGDDEIYFVISGNAIMMVDGEQRAVGPGSVVLTRSGSRHGLRNAGTEELRLFVVCARIG
jgi:mannose-6-phosphate isomerase-like protein (cupin superfamily)